MNKITIEFSAEDRARLDKLNSLLEEVTEKNPVLNVGVAELHTAYTDEPLVGVEAPQEAEEDKNESQPTTNPLENKEATEPKTEPVEAKADTEPAKVVTLQELQGKVIQLATNGKKDEAREVIMKYADSVSNVPEDKRAEVMDLLNKLEG